MLLITHVLAALLALKLLGIRDSASMFLAVTGAVLPDMDFFLRLRHRGFSHSLAFLAMLSFSLPLMVGAGSHILLDMLTPCGVRLLYPRKDWYILFGAPLKTGKEDAILIALLTGVILA